MTDPLRIEMVLPSMIAAGMESVVDRLTRQLAERGHTVGITCTQERGALADALEADGFRVRVVEVPGLWTNVRPTPLRDWFRRVQPDVVHVHSGVWLKSAHAARQAGVTSVVHTAHGLLDREPFYGPFLKRAAARYTDWVVAVSEPLGRYLTAEAGVPARKVRVLVNGVNTTNFCPGPRTGALRRQLGIAPDAPVIGHVARLAAVKNQRMLLDAFALVREAVPGSALVIVGDGPERAALERYRAERELTTDVHFAGLQLDVAGLYREFDLFALSSTAEGTSMSILEALASGVGVVATAVGGNVALLDEGRCGRLVPSGGARAMSEAMVSLLRDPAARRELGALGRAHVVARFSEDAMLDQYEALYRSPRGRVAPTRHLLETV